MAHQPLLSSSPRVFTASSTQFIFVFSPFLPTSFFVITGPPGKHISGSVNVAMTFSHSFVGFTTSLESISGTGQHVMSIAKGVMGGDETGEGPSKSKHGRSEEDWKAIRDPTIDIYADG